MSLGSWEPDADKAAQHIQLDQDLLERLSGYSRRGQLDELEQLITGADSQRLAGLMKLEHSLWLAASETQTEELLVHLIRFFTVAENLAGWEAGAQSPVIPLAKSLRRRGIKLDRDLLHWLRDVSDNRFLPYGPL